MSEPTPPMKLSPRDAELLALYAEDLLTNDQAVELNARLHAEPELLAVIVRFTEVEEHLRELLKEAHVSDRGEWYEVMSELARAEARAEVETVHLSDGLVNKPTRQSEHPSPREVGQALLYLGRQPRVWAPIAAVLALAVMLLALILVSGKPSDAIEIVDKTPDQAKIDAVPAAPVVATLTGERDVVWDRQPGRDLRSGERLTLVQGFAEITTRSGAAAILQAPATIELLESDNAIRLHTGKLVGVCDTPSSKGFVVYTRQLRVRDLGTRFGVDASAPEATVIQVFQGEVQVTQAADQALRGDDSQTMRLVAGDAVLASSETGRWTKVDPSPDRFALVKPIVQTLRGSGRGIGLREVDPHWEVVAVDGKPLGRPIEMIVSGFESHTKNFPNDPSQSQWVTYLPSKEVADRKITYVVRATLELPANIDPRSASIRMRYVPDNELSSLRINGTEISVPEPPEAAPEGRVDEFVERYEMWISSGLVGGQNTIEFELVDYAMVVGINVQWELYATGHLPQWSEGP